VRSVASLISRLQKRYIIEGDQLAHDAETCIGELCAALRKIADSPSEDDEWHAVLLYREVGEIAREALRKCAEGI